MASSCEQTVSREPILQNLIPIAVVIAAGCEKCAEKAVTRALNEGSSPQDIEKTLAIVACLVEGGCLAAAVGPEIVARMRKPLAAGRRTLERLACQRVA